VFLLWPRLPTQERVTRVENAKSQDDSQPRLYVLLLHPVELYFSQMDSHFTEIAANPQIAIPYDDAWIRKFTMKPSQIPAQKMLKRFQGPPL